MTLHVTYMIHSSHVFNLHIDTNIKKLMSRKFRNLSKMNYIQDVTFICTLLDCFVLVVHNNCSNYYKNTCDIATQTPK